MACGETRERSRQREWRVGTTLGEHYRHVVELAPPDGAASPTAQRKRHAGMRRDVYESHRSRMKFRLRVRAVSMRKRVTSFPERSTVKTPCMTAS
ncbi:hypothetical protein BAR24066_01647 [Burkholderia arboris]|uniref:Uncharacterized protein n=1 Tax=Burkholderia arboris TaxID=488730 RepID=A0A9Q9SFL9_9BURK|nr:hypothetical protein BAR24066_01647 [Burkholderia arboris]